MNDKSLNVVESYDPIAIDGPPTHRCPHLGTMLPSAVVGGKIYVIGGRLNISYECTDIVEKYNPVSDEWTTNLEPMPSRRSGIAPPASTDPFMYGVENGVKEHLIIMNDMIRQTICRRRGTHANCTTRTRSRIC